MTSVRLVSLNIERSKHLHRVLPFLRTHTPDVLCLQELLERDVPHFEALFSFRTSFVPLSLYQDKAGNAGPQGICIFSNIPIVRDEVRYYVRNTQELPTTVAEQIATYSQANRAVLFVEVEKDRVIHRISTTHFTWSERGEATALQRSHLSMLMDVLCEEEEKGFVLCGDFNLPRGGELFSQIAKKYKDNIPAHYETSIDIDLHRAKDDDPVGLSTKMVDGLFTTPEYRASDVSLVSGVSDHCAIVATIEKGA